MNNYIDKRRIEITTELSVVRIMLSSIIDMTSDNKILNVVLKANQKLWLLSDEIKSDYTDYYELDKKYSKSLSQCIRLQEIYQTFDKLQTLLDERK